MNIRNIQSIPSIPCRPKYPVKNLILLLQFLISTNKIFEISILKLELTYRYLLKNYF